MNMPPRLPNSLAAPRLGRQLQAIEWIVNTLVEAHVDALNSLTRSALPEEKAGATPTPHAGKSRAGAGARAAEENEKIVDSTSVNLVFTGSPAAARKVFNQIASAKEQFYMIRTLQVKNQADKGPKRGERGQPRQRAASPAASRRRRRARLRARNHFIVGNEHLNRRGQNRDRPLQRAGKGGSLGNGLASRQLRTRRRHRRGRSFSFFAPFLFF